MIEVAPPYCLEIERLHKKHLGRQRLVEMGLSGLNVILGKREGARFEDLRSGKWLWNCHSNGGTYNLGHRPPQVISALQAALDSYDIGNHHLLSPARAHAAAALSLLTGDRLPGVVFSATGSEANEVAIRLACLMTGRRKIVAIADNYHGTTLATAGVNQSTARRFEISMPHVVNATWNDLDEIKALIDDRTALVMLEAIPATSGFPMPAADYIKNVGALCRRVGALLLIDEVQTGLGRTGRVWSYQWDDVVPDLLVTGKGLSAGLYPIAATLISPEIYEWYADQPRLHVTTFGGAELGCIVASEVAKLVSSEALLQNVRERAHQFAEGFRDSPFEFRQRGLVSAIRVADAKHWDVWQRLKDVGVFTFPALFTPDTVQFKPPLILKESEAEEIIHLVNQALS